MMPKWTRLKKKPKSNQSQDLIKGPFTGPFLVPDAIITALEILPAIGHAARTRPGRYRRTKTDYLVADYEEHKNFWKEFHQKLEETDLFQFPVEDAEEKINPYFGYFGPRWHPVSFKPNYFNIGIEITADPKTPVRPIAKGILEHSGYGVVGGNYVMISHPDVVTEDGYKLFSFYMHLRRAEVKFTSYQKMLRQVSLNSYPELPMELGQTIGTVGDTGHFEGLHTALHLQTVFLHKKEKGIAVDPARILGIRPKKNRTRNLTTHQEFIQHYKRYRKNIHTWKLEKFWTSKFHNL